MIDSSYCSCSGGVENVILYQKFAKSVLYSTVRFKIFILVNLEISFCKSDHTSIYKLLRYMRTHVSMQRFQDANLIMNGNVYVKKYRYRVIWLFSSLVDYQKITQNTNKVAFLCQNKHLG